MSIAGPDKKLETQCVRPQRFQTAARVQLLNGQEVSWHREEWNSRARNVQMRPLHSAFPGVLLLDELLVLHLLLGIVPCQMVTNKRSYIGICSQSSSVVTMTHFHVSGSLSRLRRHTTLAELGVSMVCCLGSGQCLIGDLAVATSVPHTTLLCWECVSCKKEMIFQGTTFSGSPI